MATTKAKLMRFATGGSFSHRPSLKQQWSPSLEHLNLFKSSHAKMYLYMKQGNELQKHFSSTTITYSAVLVQAAFNA